MGSPTKVAAVPEPVLAAPVDETARRLAGILASDPKTAHALRPPPPPPDDEEDDVLELTRIVSQPASTRDLTRLAGLALGGAVLFIGGFVALGQQNTMLFLLLTPAGAVGLASAGWRLFKEAPALQTWRRAIRL